MPTVTLVTITGKRHALELPDAAIKVRVVRREAIKPSM